MKTILCRTKLMTKLKSILIDRNDLLMFHQAQVLLDYSARVASQNLFEFASYSHSLDHVHAWPFEFEVWQNRKPEERESMEERWEERLCVLDLDRLLVDEFEFSIRLNPQRERFSLELIDRRLIHIERFSLRLVESIRYARWEKICFLSSLCLIWPSRHFLSIFLRRFSLHWLFPFEFFHSFHREIFSIVSEFPRVQLEFDHVQRSPIRKIHSSFHWDVQWTTILHSFRIDLVRPFEYILEVSPMYFALCFEFLRVWFAFVVIFVYWLRFHYGEMQWGGCFSCGVFRHLRDDICNFTVVFGWLLIERKWCTTFETIHYIVGCLPNTLVHTQFFPTISFEINSSIDRIDLLTLHLLTRFLNDAFSSYINPPFGTRTEKRYAKRNWNNKPPCPTLVVHRLC